MARTAKPTNHYVSNSDLYRAICQYKELLTTNPEARMSDYIGKCLMDICDGLSRKANFRGYSYRSEMVQAAIENCVSAVRHFDVTRSNNPFGYFTMVAFRAFIRQIDLEKKEHYIRHKVFQRMSIDGTDAVGQPNDLSDDVIQKFETKMVERRQKNAASAAAKKAAKKA